MTKKKIRKKYYIKYALLFSILILAVYGYFLTYGKSFLTRPDGAGDGFAQHYTALCYYAKWLREIAKTLLFEHRIEIPEWSFSIGYGSDIITTLHYYVIGDPFNLFSVLVPLRYMQYYYVLMVFLRMYCAGLAFSAYSFYMTKEKTNYSAVLTGALLYVFCLYGMRTGVMHPYFINPMIYFPLLLLGAEKILRHEKPWTLVVTVCVSACSNFYFFYMLAIFTFLYVILRLCLKYGLKKWRKTVLEVFRVGIYALLGLALSAVIFLPVVLNVLGDIRFGGGHTVDLIYPLSYYTKFPAGFLTVMVPGSWAMMGFAGIGLPALLLLFMKRKQNTGLKISFIFLTGILMIPFCNYALNAFTYAASRWIWAYSFLIAFILVKMWPYMLQLTSIEKQWLCVSMLLYFLLCVCLENSRTENLAFSMVCVFAHFLILQLDFSKIQKKVHIKEAMILIVFCVNVSLNAYYSFSIDNSSLLEGYIDRKDVNNMALQTQDVAIAEASREDTDFFRYAHSIGNTNSTLFSGLHNQQYYWSLSNSAIVDSNNQLGIYGWTHNNYLNQNARAGVTTLSNVRYYTCPEGTGAQYAPYGFEYNGTYSTDGKGGNKWEVYKNQYSLPFGYTYDSVLDKEEFEKLTMVQKEEAMLQGVVLEESNTSSVGVQTGVISLQDEEIPFEITCSDNNISVQGKSFVTTSKNATAVLSFSGLPECETYLVWEGMGYQGCSPLERYAEESPFDPLNRYTKESWDSKSSIQKKKEKSKYRNWSEETALGMTAVAVDAEGVSTVQGWFYYTPAYAWYSGKDDYAVNMGYSVVPKTSITINFPEAGIYSYDNLKVICRGMEDYSERIEKLQEERLENTIFETDKITGEITVASNKVLCVTVPYAKGWSAYVDGRKTEISKANLMYSGVVLEKGTHKIEFIYHTPGLRAGITVTLAALIITVFICMRRKYRR